MSLQSLLKRNSLIRIIEVHNSLSALLASKAEINSIEGRKKKFHGLWLSSLTHSISKGKPDIEIIDSHVRLNTINEIKEISNRPLIVDGDTGGQLHHFKYIVRGLERNGVDAVIIEDKVGQKYNSLLKDAKGAQDTISNFAKKISIGKDALLKNNMMIIARIESFIFGKSPRQAAARARAYTLAGADGILIHSKEKSIDKIIKFIEIIRRDDITQRVPLFVVPTAFPQITESELNNLGVNVVIYANHLLRSSIPAMEHIAKLILTNDRAKEAESFCIPVNDLLNLIEGNQ